MTKGASFTKKQTKRLAVSLLFSDSAGNPSSGSDSSSAAFFRAAQSYTLDFLQAASLRSMLSFVIEITRVTRWLAFGK